MTQEFVELAAQLEELGEPEVRVRLAHGSWSGRRKAFVEEWLRSKDEGRTSSAAAKRDDREAESLSMVKDANRIASEALSIAKDANRIASEQAASANAAAAAAFSQARWAKWAAIIATIAALIAVKDQILALIFRNP